MLSCLLSVLLCFVFLEQVNSAQSPLPATRGSPPCHVWVMMLQRLSRSARRSGKPDALFSAAASEIAAGGTGCEAVVRRIFGSASNDIERVVLDWSSRVDSSSSYDESSWVRMVEGLALQLEKSETRLLSVLKSTESTWVIDNQRAHDPREAESRFFFEKVVGPCRLGSCGQAVLEYLGSLTSQSTLPEIAESILQRTSHDPVELPKSIRDRIVNKLAFEFVEEVAKYAETAKCGEGEFLKIFRVVLPEGGGQYMLLADYNRVQGARRAFSDDKLFAATISLLEEISRKMFLGGWPEKCQVSHFQERINGMILASVSSASASSPLAYKQEHVSHAESIFRSYVSCFAAMTAPQSVNPYIRALVGLDSLFPDSGGAGEYFSVRGFAILKKRISRKRRAPSTAEPERFGAFRETSLLHGFLREFARTELFTAVRETRLNQRYLKAVRSEASAIGFDRETAASLLGPGEEPEQEPVASAVFELRKISSERREKIIRESEIVAIGNELMRSVVSVAVRNAQISEVSRLWRIVGNIFRTYSNQFPGWSDCAWRDKADCKNIVKTMIAADDTFADLENLIEGSSVEDSEVVSKAREIVSKFGGSRSSIIAKDAAIRLPEQEVLTYFSTVWDQNIDTDIARSTDPGFMRWVLALAPHCQSSEDCRFALASYLLSLGGVGAASIDEIAAGLSVNWDGDDGVINYLPKFPVMRIEEAPRDVVMFPPVSTIGLQSIEAEDVILLTPSHKERSTELLKEIMKGWGDKIDVSMVHMYPFAIAEFLSHLEEGKRYEFLRQRAPRELFVFLYKRGTDYVRLLRAACRVSNERSREIIEKKISNESLDSDQSKGLLLKLKSALIDSSGHSFSIDEFVQTVNLSTLESADEQEVFEDPYLTQDEEFFAYDEGGFVDDSVVGVALNEDKTSLFRGVWNYCSVLYIDLFINLQTQFGLVKTST